MKLLPFCLSAVLLVLCSCNTKHPEGAAPEEFVFGRFACFCPDNCLTAYRLTDGKLFRGIAKCSPDELVFETTPLPEEKVALARELLKQLPAELRSACDQTFGCPDCADQGGYYLAVKQTGTVCKWRLDTQIDALPDYLQAYAGKVQEAVDGLR